MSLAIDVDRVTAVLLVDGWHTVVADSFELDAYEYVREIEQPEGTVWPAGVRLGGGQDALIPMIGATWFEGDFRLYCPLTAILAVKLKARTAADAVGSTSRQ